MWQSVEILNGFNLYVLSFFLNKLEYRFLVQSTKIEHALFPYKTAISETNVKTNKVVSLSQRTAICQ